MIWKNTKLKSELKKIVTKDVADIILFGSLTRGKQTPNDVDILVIFSSKVDKVLEYSIRKVVEKYVNNVSIVSKTQKTVVDPAFVARESVLFEGISLLNGNNITEKYGFTAFGTFKYSFAGWTNLQKTKFYHALNGRKGQEGILHKLACIKLADRIVLAPLSTIEQFRDFLNSWELEYVYIPIIIPQRLARKKILEK